MGSKNLSFPKIRLRVNLKIMNKNKNCCKNTSFMSQLMKFGQNGTYRLMKGAS